MVKIESLLSARLFLAPQVVDKRIYFISNLSGKLSLYAMNYGGSVPEPLLPPHIALQNPELIGGYVFYVFPELGQIVIMLDHDGDENYQPMCVPLDGGFPQPMFENFLADYRVHLGQCDPERNIAYLSAESRRSGNNETFQADIDRNTLLKLAESTWGAYPACANEDHTRVILQDAYTTGDGIVSLWRKGEESQELIYGVPLEQRAPGQEVPLSAIGSVHFTHQDQRLLLSTGLFVDTYGLGWLDLGNPGVAHPVAVHGTVHQGAGELISVEHLHDKRFAVGYNIDGCSWVYEGYYDEERMEMYLEYVICGQGPISNGVLESLRYDKTGDRFSLTYSTATSPTQIYTVEGPKRKKIVRHTNERVLGIPAEWLSPGEDASFTSFDGMRVSARLYLPASVLGFEGPRPVVYYVHGGPQGQERPDFAWFSMPLIQFLAMNGFAVFVPNVRGSTGYGLSYTKQVDRDWGGQDRLDHIHAMTKVLQNDPRLDVRHTGVVGRSYGGFMTLTLASRHPELWSAAVDMFGPYDLLTFSERIPPTWKPYFSIALGDPATEEGRKFLQERSPRTYIDQVACPMLVIQGKNDPRVVEQESRDLVEYLREQGKAVEYLMFENEGHDVLKYENRVTCYNAITEFFKKTLR